MIALEFEELSEKLENNPKLLENQESGLDYVIKWGTVQNPTLPKKLEKLSDDNIMILKETLQQCLQLKRYFHILKSDLKAGQIIRGYKKMYGKVNNEN
ncbi:hypothetical protein Glove_275g108 [Diversispora epigaea]|uniref:Uncharacterized protein n=1 Tax=Diversispora epigaea TaxID=1348612 RepID=A0A397I3H6_9GLOM|nr:hypothetical protein Glove_275g108 [Diversispora epigaea]